MGISVRLARGVSRALRIDRQGGGAWLVRVAARSYGTIAIVFAGIDVAFATHRRGFPALACTVGALVFAVNAVLARGVLKRA